MIKQIEINEIDAFKNCKLQRLELAISLTKLIAGFTEGGVIALNNSWGSGKTTFIKMWEGHLKAEKITTINFNAWENDFEDSPLVALIAELKNKFNVNGESNFKEILKYGGKLALDIGQVLVKNIVDKYVGDDTVSGIIDAVNKSSNEIFAKEIDNYLDRKNSIEDFKKSLTDFVSAQGGKLPIIFFIDELDRCRPSYAVKLLECVKHIFSVPNVIFILSMDKTQLCHSINGFYGSEKFDSSDYLRRFIDIEYSLPKNTTKDYFLSLIERLDFKELLNDKYIPKEVQNLLLMCEAYFHQLSLRQIEKILIHLSIIIKTNHFDFSSFNLLLFLLYLKNYSPILYFEIKNSSINEPELMDKFHALYLSDLKKSNILNEENCSVLLGELIFVYNEFLKDNSKTYIQLYNSNYSGEHDVLNDVLNCRLNSVRFLNTIISLDKDYKQERPHKLHDIIKWIELLS